jgi:LmbE family N-acetylglucosaminyl deacetylase
MADDDRNGRPGCFATTPVDEAAGVLAALLEEERADVLVIYDEHGGYGHPDHVQVHRVGARAAELAATPVLYLATMDRDFFQALRRTAIESGELGAEEMPDPGDGVDAMGEPAERITTEVDVRTVLDRKRRAMAAHASQIGPESFFLSLPEERFGQVWGQEWYVRVRPDPGAGPVVRREPALVLGADRPREVPA